MSYSGRCVQTLAAIDANHRCPACHLEGQLQRMQAECDLLSQERARLADEAIALRGQLAAAREERDIAVRRAARAVAEKEQLFDQLFAIEQAAEERRESLRAADMLERQLAMVGGL